MSTFRSIEELVKSLDREKELLKEMFAKRKSLSFRYDYALEMTEYKEERIRYLIDYGVIRDTGDFLEMEDIYLKFFEDVLEVNEEINVSFVQDYLTRLNENIDYYLKENNEQRKYNYQREVKRCLKNIALTTVRNVMDLKRNMDNTYKNEPNPGGDGCTDAECGERRETATVCYRGKCQISKYSTYHSECFSEFQVGCRLYKRYYCY